LSSPEAQLGEYMRREEGSERSQMSGAGSKGNVSRAESRSPGHELVGNGRGVRSKKEKGLKKRRREGKKGRLSRKVLKIEGDRLRSAL